MSIFSETFLKHEKKSSGNTILVNIHSNKVIYLKGWKCHVIPLQYDKYWESPRDDLYSGVVESIYSHRWPPLAFFFFFFWNGSCTYIWIREWLIPLGIHSTSNQIRKPGSCDLVFKGQESYRVSLLNLVAQNDSLVPMPFGTQEHLTDS